MSNSDMAKSMVSPRTVARLSLYRRILNRIIGQETANVFSHQLAGLAGATAAQVRRDLMAVGYSGSPVRGYDVKELIEALSGFLDAPQGQSAALVGVGNLGRAILTYFAGRRPKLAIVAAFDIDPQKVNREFRGCPCYPMSQLAQAVAQAGIDIGIITVPAESAQGVADALVSAGVRGILNFAPTPLRVGPQVHVEDLDIAVSLDKTAYFARHGIGGRRA